MNVYSFIEVVSLEIKTVMTVLSFFLNFMNIINTVNPRISPLGAYLFLAFLDGGLFEGGGLYEGGLIKFLKTSCMAIIGFKVRLF